jgi:hypothetical protein
MDELSGDSNFTMEDINKKNIRYVKTAGESSKGFSCFFFKQLYYNT